MQCNSKTLDYVKCSKYLSLAISHALSSNHHRSIALINDRLAVCQSDGVSTYQHSA